MIHAGLMVMKVKAEQTRVLIAGCTLPYYG